jgi:hypothetical protein
MRDLSVVRPGSLKGSPFFSVVVVSSHGRARLAHTLRGVRDQSVRNRDVVVVDNSTEDVLPTIVDVLPEARLIRAGRSQDFAALRNVGLTEGSGRYVAFLDSPDVWHPSYLHHHRTALQAMPDALFTVSDYMLDGPRKKAAVRQLRSEPVADNALLQMIMCPYVHSMSCFVVPRVELAAAKGFDVRRGRYAAHDLCVRLLAGPRGRRELACLTRSTPHIPHILTVRAIDQAGLDLESAECEQQRDDFIAALFGRPFMAPYADLKELCRSRLAQHQRTFFATYGGGEVATEPYSAEPSILATRSLPVRSEISLPSGSKKPPRALSRKTRNVEGVTTPIAMIHHGRTGSQLLGDLLDQHPLIAWGGELFEPFVHQLPEDPASFLKERIKECKKQMFGFETKVSHPELFGLDMAAYLAALEEIGFRKFIVLRRINLLRSFVSQLVAMARGNVYHVPARTSVELHKLRIDPQAIVLLDKPGKLVNTMRYVTQQCDSARRLLVGRDVLDLTYEDDVAEDPIRAYRRVCDFLGVKNEPVEIHYGRTTPQRLTEIIENFDEVKAALTGTEFEWMAEE